MIVTAFFDNRDDALRAMDRLSAIGLPDDALRLTEGDDPAAPGTDRNRGFLEALHDLFFPHDDHAAYAEGLSRGGHLLTVRRLSDDLHDTVVDILDDEGAIDIDERAASWRNEGWRSASITEGPAATGTVDSGTSGMAGMDTPHAGITADRADATPDSRGMVTPADRRGDMWQRDMARGGPRVRTYLIDAPISRDDDTTEATERQNLPS